MASKKVVEEMLRKALAQKECDLWPDCSCHHTLVHWQDSLRDEEKIWDLEMLDQAETLIFFALACAAKYCPDPRTKVYAKGQLAKRFWDRQKSMCIWVEP